MPTERDERIERSGRGCPCLYVEPCDARCTCVDPMSSHGCARCCRYGSIEQRTAWAARLAAFSAQRHVDTKDADALWEKFERYVDAESWTTPRCKRALSRIVQEARAEEREACARIADHYADEDAPCTTTAEVIAAAIRARREGEGEDG